VYRVAFRAAMEIFEWSRTWPPAERYALTDQVRRASRAVCANLAEAWAKRDYRRHFAAKLTDAHAEAEETITWLRFADACGYEVGPDLPTFVQRYLEVCGGLVRMKAAPEKWCR